MDIMQAILDIEDKAKEIVASAEETKAQQKEKYTAELLRLRRASEETVNEQIAGLKNAFEVRQREALEDIEREYQQKLEKLDALCQGNKERWVQEITAEIVGSAQ